MSVGLDGKVAVVTGAGGTLCSAIARHLATQGARVVLLGRSLDKLEAVASLIRSTGGQALPLQADVTNVEQVQAARNAMHRAWGPCSILINGAGGINPQQ